MRKVAIIQARMSSSRLPAKVMLKLNGKTVLEHVVSRVRKSQAIDDVVIATSVEKDDDAIAEFCQEKNISFSRGSLNNVLERYYYAAKEHKADIVVRITSDCPLYDYTVMSDMIKLFGESDLDYITLGLDRTFPRGFDTEIFKFPALEKAYYEAKEQFDLEHVTSYIRESTSIFKVGSYKQQVDLSHHRWTLDTPEDFALIKNIYKNLGSNCTTEQIVQYLDDNEDIFNLNAHIEQKAH